MSAGVPRVKATICTLVALLTACALDNPCPSGTMRGAGKCIASDSDVGVEYDTNNDPSESDAGGGSEGPLEPDIDATEPEPPDDDAGDDDAGTTPDAANPPNDDAAVECPQDALSTWRSFQISEQAVPAILSCFQKDPLCRTGVCDLSGCLMSTARVDGCDRCVAAEVACAAQHCSVPCGILTTDDACRACTCANGCLDAPAGCGFGDPQACADCSGASCSARVASATDVITVPIFFHLLHDRVDPDTGLPAYAASDAAPETILDVDAQLVQINSALASARPDARSLRVIRAGVDYVPAPAADVCADPVTWTDQRRLFGGLNVVLASESPDCPALASSAFAGRANSASLLRTVGNLLGIPPAEQGGDSWQITSEQFVRMHNFTRWRLGAADAVPASERASGAFLNGPDDPIWDKLTNRDIALSNASVFDATAVGPFASLPLVQDFTVPVNGAARRVLGVRVSAKVTGVPSDNLQVVVSLRYWTTGVVPRSAVRVVDGTLVAEEAFETSEAVRWDKLRRVYGAGVWRVSVDDTADLALTDVRLELILGDRTFGNYDRHARGVADIMLYRPSTSELLTAAHPGSRTLAFGAPVRDQLPPLPDSQAEVVSGDVDGDGNVDLLARRGPNIWIAFNKRGFATWRPGSIAGTDRPSESDEVRMGDFDGDGFGDLLRSRPDLARNQSVWAYHRGVGDGSFEAARAPALAGAPYPVNLEWMVLDGPRAGHSALVVRENDMPYLVINNNDTVRPTTSGATPIFYGGFRPAIGGTRDAWLAAEQIVALDADHDGSEDLVARRPGSAEWFVAVNQGDGSFATPKRLTIGGSPTAFEDSDTLLGAVQ